MDLQTFVNSLPLAAFKELQQCVQNRIDSEFDKLTPLQQFVDNNRPQLKTMFYNQGVIETIKFMRTHCDVGLAEAKECVDNYLLTSAEKLEYYKQRQKAILREVEQKSE